MADHVEESPLLSIIIPTLNEERMLPPLFASIRRMRDIRPEVIVVDGGSTDGTVEAAGELLQQAASDGVAGSLLQRGGGRGPQLDAGASAAAGQYLFFLHADSVLTDEALRTIEQVVSGNHSPDVSRFSIGLFRLQFDRPTLLYRFYSFFARFDSVWTTFGDQGILICRSFYHEIGGFPHYPLFEDVELLRRARCCRTIRKFRAGIVTSSRRFERGGRIRIQLRNLSLLTAYLCGADPAKLAGWYSSRVTS